MEYEPGPMAHPADIRTAAGDVLVPPEWLPVPLDQWKIALGAQASGQLQQRPVLATGGLFRVDRWMWLDRALFPADDALSKMAGGWDLAIGASEGSAATAGFVGGLLGGRCYITAGYHAHVEITGQIAMVKAAQREHPRCKRHVLEKRANAAAVLDLVRETIPGARGVEPDGDKVTRAQRWSAYQDAGNIVLPCRCGREGLHTHADVTSLPGEPWAVALVQEAASFPRGVLKDRVDAVGYLVRDLFEARSSFGVSVGSESWEPAA
jgi:predicted phage terminase large subunit-like protein